MILQKKEISKSHYRLGNIDNEYLMQGKLWDICDRHNLKFRETKKYYCIQKGPQGKILSIFEKRHNKDFNDFLNHIAKNINVFPKKWQEEFINSTTIRIETKDAWILQ